MAGPKHVPQPYGRRALSTSLQSKSLRIQAGQASSKLQANDAHRNLSDVPHYPSFESQQLPKEFLSQFKHPAQVEWEQLWYHGIVAAYQKIAHLFAELKSPPSTALADQSVSEPTLNISSLKKEEQALFEQEEDSSHLPFAPKSEAERLNRLQRATQATDERQRLALLLGLPTFREYIEQSCRTKIPCETDASSPSKRQLKREVKFAQLKEKKQVRKVQQITGLEGHSISGGIAAKLNPAEAHWEILRAGMSRSKANSLTTPAEHRPLVVGLTKPPSSRSVTTMASSSEAAALNKEIADNVKENTTEAAPSEDNPTAPAAAKPKKEKAPKQPKPQKAAASTAPTSPALIDLRVGHILRAIAHPNADSLYVSTIAMGDEEGTEHTQVDEETGKVVRTVCSGLNGLVPLEEMQNRKIIVVANLKPVNMRSIKSAAMVLAASPKQAEGADPHAPDRIVELVQPPETAEAGDKVYFEGWPYGEGKGPEKQLNPKKKQWEAIQPGFYTTEDLTVAFDAGQCEEVDGSDKGNLVVQRKGVCTVKSLKGAVVR
ncbi:G4 quadruplex nucleic acid binding protein [Lithohypha guttulata]|uniref:G4 quadruplex nucleic acid binding protein n=1 Tax=Lithohypha guttulata TaxID=1690604 RepID=A0AAN7SZJ0_9EURO|nr:G4 quadruplex nucleic acid binding protein [Lithohypha guttulata]